MSHLSLVWWDREIDVQFIKSGVFTKLKIYGSIWKNILLHGEFWIIGSFRGHFQAPVSNKLSEG